MKIAINQIILDDQIYPRSAVNEFNVGRLVHALTTGVKVPPMTVEAGTHRLIDGWHRYHAFKKMEITKVDVVEKTYASEADLFADAVRLNIGHGQPFDQYTVRNAIIRLTEYGYTRDRISDVVKLPITQIEKIERGFATSTETGKPIALKGGLSHLKGKPLDPRQQQVNRGYSGSKATFYVKQICELLEHDMWPNESVMFAQEMNRLVALWQKIVGEEEAA